jgi:hypothetical protein
MHPGRNWGRLITVGVVIFAVTACSPPSRPQSASGNSAVLAESTKVLDDATLATLAMVHNDGTLTFGATGPVLATVEVGDVLILRTSSLTPGGALLEVDGITFRGAGVELATSPAQLEQAFEELHLSATRTVTPVEITERAGITFPLDLSASDGGGSVHLTGSLGVAPSVDLVIDIDISSFSLDEFSLSFGAAETFLANLTGTGSLAFREGVTLGSIPFTPIVITVPSPAGAVPVIITPNVVIEASLEGKIQGQFEASVMQQASFEAGIGYKDAAWGGFSDSTSSFDFEAPTYSASLGVKAMAGPRLEALIYGAVGPFASASAYVELSATAEDACVRGTVDAGLTAKAGMDFLADFETTLLNEAYELTSFDSCAPEGTAPRPAVTWSRSYGRVGSDGENARGIVQASDGTYLLMGDSSLTAGITGAAASIWALRLDALGNVMWQQAYGGLFATGIAKAAAEVPGGFLLATSQDVMKIDYGGNPVWVRSYGGSGEFHSLIANSDGSAVLAGEYGAEQRAWVAKIDASGSVLWSHSYGLARFHRVRATSDGGYVAVGVTPANANDLVLVKLHADGRVAWAEHYNNRYDPNDGMVPEPTLLDGVDAGMDVMEKQGGGYVVVGETYGAFPIPEPGQAGHYAAWIFDVTAEGAIDGETTRVHRVGVDAFYTSGYALVLRPNKTSVIVGRYAPDVSDLMSTEDILMIQGGAYAVLGGAGNDSVQGGLIGGGVGSMPLIVTADGGVAVAGTSDSFAAHEQAWVVKLGRTAFSNWPYMTNVGGAMFENEHTTAVVGSSSSSNAPVTASIGSVTSEQTPITVEVQAP